MATRHAAEHRLNGEAMTTTVPAFERLGVAGAGFMGSGIAESAARAGLTVRLFEPDTGPIDDSKQRIEASVARAVARDKVSTEDAAEMRGRISWHTDLEELRDSDLVIEAIVEDERQKGDLFEELDRLLAPETLIASNTSSIPIAQLAAHTGRPDKVVGLHFFSPVPVMQLVEIVVGLETSQETVTRVEKFVDLLDKTAIHTKDRSGFIVNFLLVPYLMAAVRMYEDGFASREDIDEGMKLGCGHPMGPLTLCDMIGLDVLYSVCDSLYEEFKRDEYAPPPLMKRMVVSGHLGRKTGRGFYEYAREPRPRER